MGLAIDSLKSLPGTVVKPIAKEAAEGFPNQAGVEILKEPTKYGQGRVDESAPEHPAVEEAKQRDGSS